MAHANIIGLLDIDFTISCETTFLTDKPRNTSAPFIASESFLNFVSLAKFDLNWSNRGSKFGMSSVIKNYFLKGMLLERISNSSIDKNIIDLQKKLTLMRILPYTFNLKLKLKLINIINKQI